jgi:hypothetical protein
MVNELIHNYKIKLNDLQGSLQFNYYVVITSGNFEISKSLYRLEIQVESRGLAGRPR